MSQRRMKNLVKREGPFMIMFAQSVKSQPQPMSTPSLKLWFRHCTYMHTTQCLGFLGFSTWLICSLQETNKHHNVNGVLLKRTGESCQTLKVSQLLCVLHVWILDMLNMMMGLISDQNTIIGRSCQANNLFYHQKKPTTSIMSYILINSI